MRFAKGHGTENDFVILLDPDGREGLTAGLAARLCDRRAGIGGDGVLRAVRTTAMTGLGEPGWAGLDGPGAHRPDGTDGAGTGAQACPEWFMDYRNADGSLAEMCGNGIRVFASYLAQHGLAEGPEFTVATRSGPRQVRLSPPREAGGPGGDGEAGGISADMGAVEVLGPGSAVIGGRAVEGLRVSVGNPHLACLVGAPLAAFDLSRPPGLDPGDFPGGGNVELVRVTGPRSVAMRVHERGSGETRSCGTGAVAAAAAAATATGHDGGAWTVAVPGGQLTVTLEAGRAWLAGPAVIVAEGELAPAWLAGAMAAGPGVKAEGTAHQSVTSVPADLNELRAALSDLVEQLQASPAGVDDPDSLAEVARSAQREAGKDKPNKHVLGGLLRALMAGLSNSAALASAVVAIQHAVTLLL